MFRIAKALGISLPELFEFSAGLKDSTRTHRREVEALTRLLLRCPAKRLPAIAKIIEQAVGLTD